MMKRTITMIVLLVAVVSLAAQNSKTYTVNGVSFKMILVQGGSFTMGCTSEQGSDCFSDEKPSHSVTLSDFWMGETEVTQALWKAVMGNNPSGFTGDNLPVESVSWDDCQNFIKKLNSQLSGVIPSDWRFALPTEAQWEYAARGGKNKSYYKYAGSNSVGDVAWYPDNSNSKTHTVKSKKPNALGLYDMSGNVFEWCADWSSASYYGVSAVGDPKGPSSGTNRVVRGGSYYNESAWCRVSRRGSKSADARHNNFGFRIVLIHK